ncbi:hypothetical protein EIP86_001435 [Pleurotus ostreatoroseus]|nr:hypothetical protein EIP86_001435 [Pleurotus ostreatoroseus]
MAVKRYADLSESRRSLKGQCKALKAELEEVQVKCAEMEGQCTDEIEQRLFAEKAFREEERFRMDVSEAGDRQLRAAQEETRKAKDAHKALSDQLRKERAKNEMLRHECDRRDADDKERDDALRTAHAHIAELCREVAQAKSDAATRQQPPPATTDFNCQSHIATIQSLQMDVDVRTQENASLKEMLRAHMDATDEVQKELEELRAQCSQSVDAFLSRVISLGVSRSCHARL